jgi:predicted small lipoprotein YifL
MSLDYGREIDMHLRVIKALGLTAALVIATTIAGCGTKGETQMTSDEARNALQSLIQETARHVRDETWNEVVGPPYSSSCGEEGRVKFSYSVNYSIGADPKADAEKVAEYWSGLGMKVRVSDGPILVVYGSGGPVSVVSFGTGPSLYDISGTSRCSTTN